MKAFIFLVGFVVLAAAELPPEVKEKIRQAHKHCLSVTGVDETIAVKTREGQFPDDAKLKQYLLCIAKKFHFVNDAGELQVDNIKKSIRHLTEEEVNTIVSKCVKQKATAEETVFELRKCWHENNPHKK